MVSAPPNVPEILVVEDNPGDQRLIQEALGKGRHRLRFASDGVEALDYLYRRGKFAQTERPALIILDLNLPKKDGADVLAEIKRDQQLRCIPVVVFTTSRAESDIAASYASHANCYVTKPHDLEEYLRAIGNLEKFWLSTVTLPPADGRLD
jgi:CheY-like chemotaxis protein